MSGRPLVHLLDAGRPQVFQPGQQLVETAAFAVDVEVQAVLALLALGYVLEEQAPAAADAAGLVERVRGVADRGVAAEGLAATMLDDCFLAEVPGGQQLLDESAGVLHLVLEGRSPEVREGPAGLTKDAGWQIGVSRTLPHPAAAVWDFISGPEGIALWLGPGAVLIPERGAPYRTAQGVTGEVRGHRPAERIRVTHGTTTVQIALAPAAAGARTTLRFHQEHLASAQERERQRAHWQQVMDQVAIALDRR